MNFRPKSISRFDSQLAESPAIRAMNTLVRKVGVLCGCKFYANTLAQLWSNHCMKEVERKLNGCYSNIGQRCRALILVEVRNQ